MSNIDEIAKQEQQLQFEHFSLDDAWQIGCQLKMQATANNSPVIIEIYAFEQVLFYSVCPGSSKDQSYWVKMKRQTVMRYGHSTHYLSFYNAAKNRVFETQPHIDATQYCAHGGSFPIRLKGSEVIGAITVAGMSSEQDHQLIVDTLSQWLDNQA